MLWADCVRDLIGERRRSAAFQLFLTVFICTAAALVIQRLCSTPLKYAFFSHESSEPAHVLMLKHLGAQPGFGSRDAIWRGHRAVVAGDLIELGVNLFNDIFDRRFFLAP